ncbi:leader peptidase (prepilin peptidase) / N-methyltransferase [Micromonospora matsumotoense]|uniref:Leader peptidase (Prepilin peptidase) / N-methyltransferase n=1 Tax=Micromonospora matsumotoense TaxID=121616 RepID=A0A1C4TWC5_9ACTN|nr:prepilin peptidase [Micromonospora matsumotoense]SCE63750.1 leader peptidase (prepilin peptidase) / N-methyltransferase [Micromonospora matsumotoense]
MISTVVPIRAGARAMLPALAVVPLLRYAVAVHSVADDQPWRTTCPCGQPLWPDAIGPSGRCAGCERRVGAAPYAVEAAAMALIAGLVASGRTGWALAALAWWAAGMVVLFFVDLAVMRLPHRITAVTTAGFLALLAVSGDPRAWWRAVGAGLVLAVFFAVLAVVSHGQLGWGDVAVAVPVAAVLGWHSWSAVYAGTLLGLGAAALAAVILRRTGRLAAGAYLPLGPFLVAAAAAVVV